MNVIEANSLSEAWLGTFTACYNTSGGKVSPISASFPVNEANQDVEIPHMRSQLDAFMSTRGLPSIATVSETIFPQSLWKLACGDRQILYRNYLRIYPRIQITPANRKGIYFQRMIAFPKPAEDAVNQLEHIISTWNGGNHRGSALQAAIFNPCKDHSNAPILGFPCLHQVAFHPEGSNGCHGFSVVAFYAKQLSLEKAYGNYLGLYNLGRFMAQEMGLNLTRVTCVTSVLEMSNKLPKAEAKPLIDQLQDGISE